MKLSSDYFDRLLLLGLADSLELLRRLTVVRLRFPPAVAKTAVRTVGCSSKQKEIRQTDRLLWVHRRMKKLNLTKAFANGE